MAVHYRGFADNEDFYYWQLFKVSVFSYGKKGVIIWLQ
jgi:hypothetical protein